MKSINLAVLPVAITIFSISCLVIPAHTSHAQSFSYPIVDTGQDKYYSDSAVIPSPSPGDAFYGQDAQYHGAQTSYTDNGDGTITDNVTGLMWQQDMGEKMTWDDAMAAAVTLTLGGYDDWRVPTIKELYSIIQFTGSNGNGIDEDTYVPYIDTDYFIQPFGDQDDGERIIDAQTWSSTEYVGRTMQNDETVFGVNFIDGRIKGYPKYMPGSFNIVPNVMYFRMVRGNPGYGDNSFTENGDGTVTDTATGLMWQQADEGVTLNWQEALAYAENLELAGHDDWRLPNAKELQSIVDYSRSPQTTASPAIDPVFTVTGISDPEGNPGQYPYFWTGTTHLDGIEYFGAAVYIAFGEAQGEMHGELMDVHGAGAQRSDPKTGNPDDYPVYFGPQGDVRYVFNYVRCVRDAGTPPTGIKEDDPSGPVQFSLSGNYPNPFNPQTLIQYDLTVSMDIRLDIHTVTGQKVKTLADGFSDAGTHQILWNGTDESGNTVSSGTYICKMVSGSQIETAKMVFIR